MLGTSNATNKNTTLVEKVIKNTGEIAKIEESLSKKPIGVVEDDDNGKILGFIKLNKKHSKYNYILFDVLRPDYGDNHGWVMGGYPDDTAWIDGYRFLFSIKENKGFGTGYVTENGSLNNKLVGGGGRGTMYIEIIDNYIILSQDISDYGTRPGEFSTAIPSEATFI